MLSAYFRWANPDGVGFMAMAPADLRIPFPPLPMPGNVQYDIQHTTQSSERLIPARWEINVVDSEGRSMAVDIARPTTRSHAPPANSYAKEDRIMMFI